MEAADLVVINTCAIREAAEAKVIGRQGVLRTLKAANPGMRVVLTGCAVRERDRGGLARRFPAVDLFLRPDEEPELVERLGLSSAQGPVGLASGNRRHHARQRHSRSRRPTTSPARGRRPSRRGALRRDSPVAAWIPIIYGCDKTCTYCIVPFSRGPERSRPFDEILAEARALAAAGYREITLLGQNVNSYGHDLPAESRFGHAAEERWAGRRIDRTGRPDLAELIRAIDALRGDDGRPAIPRLRFITSHPVGPLRPADRRDGRVPVRVRGAPPAGPVGRRCRPAAHGAPVLDRALPGAPGADPDGRSRDRDQHGRHRRLLRRDARSSSRRRSRSFGRFGTTRSSRQRTRRARERRPPASPTTSRRT